MIRRRVRPRYPSPRKKKRRPRTIAFDEFANIYMRRWSKVRKATWDDDRNALRKYLLPAYGHTPIGDIRRQEVWTLLDTVAARHPGAANRLRSLLSRMFNLACDWGYLPDTHINPVYRIPKYPEGVRDRYLTPGEHARLECQLDLEDDIYLRCFFRLLLRTALRKSELLNLRWDELDLTLGELCIGRTKNGKPHHLPLSHGALELFRAIPQTENPFVFPGLPGKPRANVDAAWRKIRIKSGLPDVWIHDLRRTAASYMAQAGESLYLISRALNHSTTGTTARYARFQKGDIRDALNRLSDRLDSA